MNPSPVLPSCPFTINFILNIPPTLKFFEFPLHFSFPHQNSLNISLIPNTYHTSYLILFTWMKIVKIITIFLKVILYQYAFWIREFQCRVPSCTLQSTCSITLMKVWARLKIENFMRNGRTVKCFPQTFQFPKVQ
jgi:hypothetical protein